MPETPIALRPTRIRILDSMGRRRTLLEGTAAFEQQGGGRSHNRTMLFLGLGPKPDDAAGLAARYRGMPGSVQSSGELTAFVECPAFQTAMEETQGEEYLRALAKREAEWTRLTPAEALDFFRAHSPTLWAYHQGLRLFPEFWAPLQAAFHAQSLMFRQSPSSMPKSAILVPGGNQDLLHQELMQAITHLGMEAIAVPAGPKSSPQENRELEEILVARKPKLMLSVNLRGLDRAGERFHLLQAMGVATGLWFVDNPWHILSTLRQPWWRELPLFVTDHSFIPQLSQHGAKRVFHLPLASSPFFDQSGPAVLSPHLPAQTRMIFVGRSAFPERDAFFAAASKDTPLLRRAETMLYSPEGGRLPHFHWWVEQAREAQLLSRLWPGHEVRFAGWGAEYVSLRQRALWLEALSPCGLSVVGDAAWKTMLPPATKVLPPVDYYRNLPGLYASAPFSLNITSLLLPAGLTQRHFDVWRAGGFLLSTRNAGMDIFPADLAAAICSDSPEEIRERFDQYENNSRLKEEIRQEWQDLITQKHSYEQRLCALLRHLDLLDLIS